MKRFLPLLLIALLATGSVALFAKLGKLDRIITARFEGRRWELPARLYGRPLELYAGRMLAQKNLIRELDLLGYKNSKDISIPGTYAIDGHRVRIHSRDFSFADGRRAGTSIAVTIRNNHIRSLIDLENGEDIALYRLEPLQIAAIYPRDNEDRLLIRLQDTPPLLVDILLLTEDRRFYHHIGIRPLAIVRALLANIRAGKTVQGGSTLTQQLVKNFFLSSEQSLKRKIHEALMALLLEYHYSKDEILETYLNEIYLGQEGKRAIHGFALASRFYFDRNLDELSADQLALLVGLARGASFYDPRRHPERAKKRRDLILTQAGRAGLLSPAAVQALRQRPLGVSQHISSGITRYPAFVQMARRQLKRDYREEDLRSEGLVIFTTLDPIMQEQAEKSVQQTLAAIEHDRKMDADSLQAALILCSAHQGEVQAVVGDRLPGRAGFNRALDMRRPIGSVIKPAIYLNALSRPDRFNLLSLLDDSPITIPLDGKAWEPQNYDKTFHGPVTLRQALVHSLNVATVRLGMELGLDSVINTLHGLGISESLPPYPSLLLGAVDVSPINVLQMYQTIAAGGYRTPLRTILTVMDQNGHILRHYPLTVKQAARAAPVFCLTNALLEVTRTGTAASLRHLLPSGLIVAGKTGTTNDQRDSWFAGFTGSHVAVAWVGRDDNRPTGLTGASGALRIWAELMKKIATRPLAPEPPENIDFYFSDIDNGKLFADQCRQGTLLPFIRGGILPPVTGCTEVAPARSSKQPATQPTNTLEQTLHQGIRQLLRIFQ